MGIEAAVGVPAPLSFTTPDGNTSLGVRAYVQQLDGTDLGFVTVPHMARGRYTAPYTFGVPGVFMVDFIPYVDTSFAAEDVTYTRRTDIFDVRPDVWDEPTAQHQAPGTFGAAVVSPQIIREAIAVAVDADVLTVIVESDVLTVAVEDQETTALAEEPAELTGVVDEGAVEATVEDDGFTVTTDEEETT